MPRRGQPKLSRLNKLCCPCFYCGQTASCYDHVTPFCVVGHLTDTVPCCSECNSLLGSKIFINRWYKKQYIHQTLKKRYRKTLNFRIRTEEELSEVRGMLRGELQSEGDLKKVIQARVDYALHHEDVDA